MTAKKHCIKMIYTDGVPRHCLGEHVFAGYCGRHRTIANTRDKIEHTSVGRLITHLETLQMKNRALEIENKKLKHTLEAHHALLD